MAFSTAAVALWTILSSRAATGGGCPTVDREISRFPRKERLHMPVSLTTPGPPGARAAADAPEYVAFHHMHGVGTQNRKLSRLNAWPTRTPVNASPRPSRATAHDKSTSVQNETIPLSDLTFRRSEPRHRSSYDDVLPKTRRTTV